LIVYIPYVSIPMGRISHRTDFGLLSVHDCR